MINFAINGAIGAGIGSLNSQYIKNPIYQATLISIGAVAAVALTFFTAAHATKLLVIAAFVSLFAAKETVNKASAVAVGLALGVLFTYVLPVPALVIGSNGLNLIWII